MNITLGPVSSILLIGGVIAGSALCAGAMIQNSALEENITDLKERLEDAEDTVRDVRCENIELATKLRIAENLLEDQNNLITGFISVGGDNVKEILVRSLGAKRIIAGMSNQLGEAAVAAYVPEIEKIEKNESV